MLPEHTKRAAGARADGAAVRVETLESRTLLSAQLVSDVATPGTLRLEMVTVRNKLFFNGYDAEHATELWVTDGTATGTRLVKDLDPATTSQVSQLRNVGGTLMFYAVTPDAGGAVWKSDGTAAGTVMAVDPLPGPEFASIRDLTVVNGRLFFSATVNGSSSIYQTDGTAAGTRAVSTISSFSGELKASGNKLYWVDSGALRLYGRNLDAVYTVSNAGPFPGNLTDVNGTLYFTASDTQAGIELWRVTNNSTAARVKDVRPGTAGSYPQNLTNVNGTLMFYADDGAGQRGLWKSDGTAAGTAMVARNDPGTLASVGSYLFFVARGEPWRSDGTAAGTVLVADINLNGPSDPARPTVMGQYVYCMASDGVGRHLWRATVQPAATMSGSVFNDFDGDGARDAGDNPLPGRTVYDDANNDGVLDPSEWRTITDDAGVYRLGGLAAGTHRVRLYLPPRWKQTPAGGRGGAVRHAHRVADPHRQELLRPGHGTRGGRRAVRAGADVRPVVVAARGVVRLHGERRRQPRRR